MPRLACLLLVIGSLCLCLCPATAQFPTTLSIFLPPELAPEAAFHRRVWKGLGVEASIVVSDGDSRPLTTSGGGGAITEAAATTAVIACNGADDLRWRLLLRLAWNATRRQLGGGIIVGLDCPGDGDLEDNGSMAVDVHVRTQHSSSSADHVIGALPVYAATLGGSVAAMASANATLDVSEDAIFGPEFWGVGDLDPGAATTTTLDTAPYARSSPLFLCFREGGKSFLAALARILHADISARVLFVGDEWPTAQHHSQTRKAIRQNFEILLRSPPATTSRHQEYLVTSAMNRLAFVQHSVAWDGVWARPSPLRQVLRAATAVLDPFPAPHGLPMSLVLLAFSEGTPVVALRQRGMRTDSARAAYAALNLVDHGLIASNEDDYVAVCSRLGKRRGQQREPMGGGDGQAEGNRRTASAGGPGRYRVRIGLRIQDAVGRLVRRQRALPSSLAASAQREWKRLWPVVLSRLATQKASLLGRSSTGLASEPAKPPTATPLPPSGSSSSPPPSPPSPPLSSLLQHGDGRHQGFCATAVVPQPGSSRSSRGVVVAHFKEALGWLLHPSLVGPRQPPTWIHIYHKHHGAATAAAPAESTSTVGECGNGVGQAFSGDENAASTASSDRTCSLPVALAGLDGLDAKFGRNGNRRKGQRERPRGRHQRRQLHVQRVRQLNVGNECSAYLQFVVDNYDCLPDVVFFLQGEPFEHSPNILRHVARAEHLASPGREIPPFVMYSKLYKSYTSLGEPWCEHLGNRTCDLFSAAGLGRDRGASCPHVFASYANSLFSVRRELIRQQPRDFYRSLLLWVNGERPRYGPETEATRRLWQFYGLDRYYARRDLDCAVLEGLWHCIFDPDSGSSSSGGSGGNSHRQCPVLPEYNVDERRCGRPIHPQPLVGPWPAEAPGQSADVPIDTMVLHGVAPPHRRPAHADPHADAVVVCPNQRAQERKVMRGGDGGDGDAGGSGGDRGSSKCQVTYDGAYANLAPVAMCTAAKDPASRLFQTKKSK